MLWWMVGAVSIVALTIGGALVSLVIWLFKELKLAVDAFPSKLELIHDEVVEEFAKQSQRIEDVKTRLVRLETICHIKHSQE